jgi:hypothetical protein
MLAAIVVETVETIAIAEANEIDPIIVDQRRG